MFYDLFNALNRDFVLMNYSCDNDIKHIKGKIYNYFDNLDYLYFTEVKPQITIEGVKEIKKMFYDKQEESYMKSYIEYLRQRDFNELTKDEDDI